MWLTVVHFDDSDQKLVYYMEMTYFTTKNEQNENLTKINPHKI